MTANGQVILPTTFITADVTSLDGSADATADIHSANQSQPHEMDESLNHMILIKRELEPSEIRGVTMSADTTSITPPEFAVFPDSSSQKTSSTMWEDIASSIKKLDPDHADVLLEAAPHNTLPPVSTVVSGTVIGSSQPPGGSADYYTPQPHYSASSFNTDHHHNHLFATTSTRLSGHDSNLGPGSNAVNDNLMQTYSTSTPSSSTSFNSHLNPSTTSSTSESEMIQMLEFDFTSPNKCNNSSPSYVVSTSPDTSNNLRLTPPPPYSSAVHQLSPPPSAVAPSPNSRSAVATAASGSTAAAPSNSRNNSKQNKGSFNHKKTTTILDSSEIVIRVKYNRRNNPDLEKRRIHFCDHPGCTKVYTKSSHLKAHQRIHTGNCQSVFYRVFSLTWFNIVCMTMKNFVQTNKAKIVCSKTASQMH